MKIGHRTRRAGMVDRILTQKRAEVARMLAAPPLPLRRSPLDPARAGRPTLASVLRVGPLPRLIPEVRFKFLARPETRPLSRRRQDRATSPPNQLSVALDAPTRALHYASAGATVIAVATDATFLGGSMRDLARVRDALPASTGLAPADSEASPLLVAEDFFVHPVQVDRAADAGADAIVVVFRLLDDHGFEVVRARAEALGLEPIVEVDSEAELERGLGLTSGDTLFAVSSRDLNTLRASPDRGRSLATLAATRADVVVSVDVGEPFELDAWRAPAPLGIIAGDSLMRQDDPRPLLRRLLSAA
jgi:indole-3-glycerol phosphate synthase